MKKVLAIVPYTAIYPPTNGGMQRCFHVLHQLCKYFDVTIVMHQDTRSFLAAAEKYPAIANSTVISTREYKNGADVFDILPEKLQKAVRYRVWRRSLQGPANDDFLRMYPVLARLLGKEQYDLVILENMSSLMAVPVIRRLGSASQIFYDAHNVDSNLLRQSAPGNYKTKFYEQVYEIESSLHKLVHGIFACSERDLDEFKQINTGPLRGTVIPNGVEIKTAAVKNLTGDQLPSNRLLFCGSLAYPPNREGLEWFCLNIWPLIVKEISNVELMVVGADDPGDKLKELLKQPFITYYGRVDDVDPYYRKAAVAVVPLLTGSGTRLKVLEAMGRQVPVVATSKGAEGIDYTAGGNMYVADEPAVFAEKTVTLLRNKEAANAVASAGFSFVKEHYDWDIIGKKLSRFLNERLHKKSSIETL